VIVTYGAGMSKDWVRVILNPTAGQGRARGKLGEIERALASHAGRSEILVTHGPGHAVELARAAHGEGVDVIAVVGGDGTLNEVVQAYIGEGGKPRPGPDLALIPAGTGGDFRRTMGIHNDVGVAVARATSGQRKEVDLGVLEFDPHPGQSPIRAFVNVASFGLSGAVDALVKSSPGFLGGKGAFFVATLRAMARFENPNVRVKVDGHPWFEGPAMTVAMGNGKYFGGGMMITPDADPSDGKLSIVSLGDLTRRGAMGLTSKIYSGTHVHTHGVKVTSGTRVEAEPIHAWASVLLDVDGEQPGKLPVVATLHKGALRFRV
jgi:YegS/Rv2252/BmrU family lipid kinase